MQNGKEQIAPRRKKFYIVSQNLLETEISSCSDYLNPYHPLASENTWVSQKFCKVRHNLAAPDVFAEVVKVTNYTGL